MADAVATALRPLGTARDSSFAWASPASIAQGPRPRNGVRQWAGRSTNRATKLRPTHRTELTSKRMNKPHEPERTAVRRIAPRRSPVRVRLAPLQISCTPTVSPQRLSRRLRTRKRIRRTPWRCSSGLIIRLRYSKSRVLARRRSSPFLWGRNAFPRCTSGGFTTRSLRRFTR
jgi:hypothetical protein